MNLVINTVMMVVISPYLGFELSTKLKNENKKTCLNIFNCENPFIFKDNISMDSFYKNLFFYEDDLIGQFKYDNNLDQHKSFQVLSIWR